MNSKSRFHRLLAGVMSAGLGAAACHKPCDTNADCWDDQPFCVQGSCERNPEPAEISDDGGHAAASPQDASRPDSSRSAECVPGEMVFESLESLGNPRVTLAVDRDRGVHLAFSRGLEDRDGGWTGSAAEYAYRSVSDMGWTQQMVDRQPLGRSISSARVAVDDSGIPHLIHTVHDWKGTDQYFIYYSVRDHPDLPWSTEVVGEGNYAAFDIHGSGVVYMVYATNGLRRYAYKPLGSNWQMWDVPIEPADPEARINCCSIAVDSARIIHFLYNEYRYDYRQGGTDYPAYTRVYHLYGLPGKAMSGTMLLASDVAELGRGLAIDRTDGLHVAVSNRANERLDYLYRSPTGTQWSDVEAIDLSYGGWGSIIRVDDRGGVYVAWQNRAQIRYAYRPPGGGWQFETMEPFAGRSPGELGRGISHLEFVVDVAGEIHVTTRLINAAETVYGHSCPE